MAVQPWRRPTRLLLLLGMVMASLRSTSARSEFDQGLAVELFSGLSCLMDLPWKPMRFMVSGFDSGFLAKSESVLEPYVSDQLGMDQNETRHTLWQAFKYSDTSIYFVYIGFKNGRIMGYYRKSTTDLSPVWTYAANENSSCPAYGVYDHCRMSYNDINAVTGARKETNQSAVNGTKENHVASRYDPRWRPWYIKAIAHNGSVWSDVYVFVDVLLPGITATSHVYTRGGEYLGIAAVDYLLSDIESTVFDSGNINNNSTVIFIVDDHGLMVAASVQNVSVTPAGSQRRATECPDLIIAGTAKLYNTTGWSLSSIQTIHVPEVGYVWAQSSAFEDSFGLLWYVVVVEKVECPTDYYIGHSSCTACPTHSTCTSCINISSCRCDENYFEDFRGQHVLYCSFCPGSGTWDNSTCLFEEDLNIPSWDIKVYCLVLAVVHCVSAFGCAVWTWRNRKRRIVVNAQPTFLFLILLGSVTGNLAIIPLTIDDKWADSPGVNAACSASLWLYALGFALMYSSLLTKLFRIRSIFQNSTRSLNKSHRVRVQDVIVWVVAAVSVEAIFLLIWSLASPLEYHRECNSYDVLGNGQCVESTGACNDGEGLTANVFIPILITCHVLILVYSCYFSYIIRNVNTEFQEGQWIAMCVFSQLQVNLLGGTVLLLLVSSPSTQLLVRSTVVFLDNMSVVLLLFVPKMWAEVQDSAFVERMRNASRSFIQSFSKSKVLNTTKSFELSGADGFGGSGGAQMPKFGQKAEAAEADLTYAEQCELELALKDTEIKKLRKEVAALSKALRFRQQSSSTAEVSTEKVPVPFLQRIRFEQSTSSEESRRTAENLECI